MRSTPKVASRHRRKSTLKQTKGMQSARRKSYKLGKQAVTRSLQYSYRDRRNRKREFRQLWNKRINAACRLQDVSYSKFIHGLRQSNIEVDRKVLAYLAAEEPKVFSQVVETSTQPK